MRSLRDQFYRGRFLGDHFRHLILKMVPLSSCTITLSKTSYTYDGQYKSPSVTVKDGSKVLTRNIDYKIAGYSNNLRAGTASVKIIGTDDQSGTINKTYYSGTVTKTFKINPKSLASAKISGISEKTYTGKAIKPEPTVKLDSKTLTKGLDYTLSYKNNKAVGKATVTVTGKSNYKGSVSKTFTIKPKKPAGFTLSSPKTRTMKITLKETEGISGYEIKYSTSKKFTAKTSNVISTKKTTKSLTGLQKGKTYYVKVRTYKTSDGKIYYSEYSAVKSIKLK